MLNHTKTIAMLIKSQQYYRLRHEKDNVMLYFYIIIIN